MRSQNIDLCILLGTSNPAGGMFTSEHTSLPVISVAIGHMTRLAQQARPVTTLPAIHGIADDITENQVMIIRMPNWTLDKFKSIRNDFQLGIGIYDIQ